MKIDWTTVIAVIIAMLILGGAFMFFTKRKVDAQTGVITTKFSGFSGN